MSQARLQLAKLNLSPAFFVKCGIFALFIGFFLLSGNSLNPFKAHEAKAFACTLTVTGNVNWNGAAWANCNGSYPGAGNNNDTVVVTTTTTGILTLNVSLTNTLGSVTFNNPSASQTLTLAMGANNLKATSLTLSGSSATRVTKITLSTATLEITGTITGTATTNTITMTGGGNLKIGGNWTNAGLVTTGCSTCTVTYNGTGAQTMGSAATYQNLTINNTAASGTKVTASTTTTVLGNLLVMDGQFNTAGTTLAVTGTSTINSGAEINISSATGSKAFNGGLTIDNGGKLWLITAVETVSVSDLVNNGTVEFDVADPFTITGSITNAGTWDTVTSATGAITMNGSTKTISGSGAMTIASLASTSVTNTNTGGLTVSGAISGTLFTNGANGILTVGATPTVTTLTANATGNSVTYTGGTIKAESTGHYYDLTITTGTVTNVSSNTIVDRYLTVSSGTFNISNTTGTFTVTNTTTVNGGTLSVTGATTTKLFTGLITVSSGTFSGTSATMQFGGGITQSGSGTVSLTGAAAATLTADQTFTGTMQLGALTLNSGVDVILAANASVTTVGTVDGVSSCACTWTQGTNSTFSYGGGAAVGTTLLGTAGTFDASASGNTVNYSANGAQTVKAVTYHHLTLSTSSTKTMTGVTTINGNFAMSGSAVTSGMVVTTIGGTVDISGTAQATFGAAIALPSTLSLTSTNSAGLITSNNTFSVASTTTIGSGATFSHRSNTTLTFSGDVALNGTLSNTAAGTGTTTVTGNITGSGTITLTAATNTFKQEVAADKNFGTTSGTNVWAFSSLMFSNSNGTTHTITQQTGGSGAITVSGTLSVGESGDPAAIVLDPGNRTWTLTGSGTPLALLASPAGSICPPATCGTNTSTFNYDPTSNNVTITMALTTYYNLTMDNVSDSTNSGNTFTLSGNTTVTNQIKLGHSSSTNADTLNISTYTLTLSGSGTGASQPLCVNSTDCGNSTFGTPNFSSGTVIYSGSTATDVAIKVGNSNSTITYGNLEIKPSGSVTFTLGSTASGTLTVSGNLALGNGSNSGIITAATNNPTLDVNGNVVINTSGTLIASASAPFTIAGNFTNSGTFTHSNGNVTFDTTGTSVITGSTTFYSFTATTSTKIIEVDTSTTITTTSGGVLTLTGVTIRRETGDTGSWTINHQGSESITNTTISWSACHGSSTDIDAYTSNGNVNGGNNGTCWKFTLPGNDISGFLYANETGTAIDCSTGGSRTVTVKVNGAGSFTGTCSLNTGAFTVSTVTSSAGDVLTVFISGATEKAATVTISNGAVITGLPLYQNRLTLRHESGSSITNNATTGIGRYDKDNDATNLFFTANSNALSVDSGYKLVIPSSYTYAPGGNVTVDSLEVAGTFTGTGGSYELHLTGSGSSTTCTDASGTVQPLCGAGTFTAPNLTSFEGTNNFRVKGGSYNTLYLAPASGKTATLDSTTFTIAGSSYGAGFDLASGIIDGATNDPTITLTSDTYGLNIYPTATFQAPDNTISIAIDGNNYNFDIDPGGVFTANTSTVKFTSATGVTIGMFSTAMTGGNSLYNLTIDVGAGNGQTFTAGVALVVKNTLTIISSSTGTATLAMGANSLTVGSTSVTNSGNIYIETGHSISQSSAATTTILSSAAGAGVICGASSNSPSCGGSAGTIGAYNLTVGDGSTTFSTTVTGSPAINVANTFTIATNATFSAGASTITLTKSSGTPLTINSSGVFTPSTSTVVFDPSTNGSSITVAGASYNNLTLDNSNDGAGAANTFTLGGTTSASGQILVGHSSSTNADTFSISTFTLTISGTGATTSQPLCINNTDCASSVKGLATFSSGTVDYTGNGATSIALRDGAGTTISYNNLGIKPAGSVTHTLGSAASLTLTVTGNLTLGNGSNSGIITAATNNPTINVTGNMSIAANTTYTKGTGITTFTGSTVGGVTYTDSTSTKQNIGKVTVNKTHGTAANNKLTLASSMTVDTLTIGADDTFDMASGSYTLTIANSGSTATVFDFAGTATFTAGNGTVEFTATNSGGNIEIGCGNEAFYNLTLTGTETYVDPICAQYVSNALTVNANATFSPANTYITGDFTGSGTVTVQAGYGADINCNKSVCLFGPTGNNDWTFEFVYINTLNAYGSTSTVRTASGGSGKIATSGAAGSVIKIGTSSQTYSVIFDNETNDRVIDINGTSTASGDGFFIDSKGTYQASSTAAFTNTSNWKNSGTFTANSGTITFDAGGVGRLLEGTMTGASSFYTVVFNNASGGWSFGANSATATNNFTVTAGAVTAPSTTLTVGGNFTNTPGTTTSFAQNNGTVVFNDNTKTSTLAGATTFNNLSVTTAGKDLLFTAGQTFAVNGILTLTGSSGVGNDITLNSTTGSSSWTIDTTGLDSASVTYTTVTWSACTVSTPTIDASGGTNTDGGNNGDCWVLVVSRTVSGSIYQSDDTTLDTTVYTLKLSANGGTATSISAAGDGTFSFSKPITDGQILTMWIDGHANKAALVFRYGSSCTGTPNCTGLRLTVGQVRIDEKGGSNMTTTNFDACTNTDGAGCADADIGFDTDGSHNLTVDSGRTLKVATGITFAPGANVTTPALNIAGTYTGSTETLTLNSTSGTPLTVGGTFTPSTNTVVYAPASSSTITLGSTTYHHLTLNSASTTFNLPSGGIVTDTASGGGDLTITAGTLDAVSGGNYAISIGGNFASTGTFTPRSGTVTFTATGTGHTIAPATFYNVVFNGSGGGWSFSNTTSINNDLVVTAGTLSGTSTITVNGGDVTGNGTITITGGTFTVSGDGSFGGSSSWTFYNLTTAGVSSTTTATGAGGVTVSGVLLIDEDHILVGGSKTWTLTANGNVFFIDGTWDAGTSTFVYAPVSTTGVNVKSTGYHNIQFNKASNTFSLGIGGISTTGDLTITAGALDVVSSQNYPISVGGNWSNSDTFLAQSGTVTFTATTTGKTIIGMSSSNPFYNLVFNGSGGGWTNTGPIQVNNDLTMTTGTLSGTGNITVLGGDVTGNGTINKTNGNFLVDGSGNFGGDTNWTFSTLTFGDGSGTTTTTSTGSGTVTASVLLNIAANQTLDAKGKTWTLSGTSGTVFTISGTLTDTTDTSTFSFTGNNTGGNTSIPSSAGYHNITINNASETYAPLSNITLSGDLTMSAGTLISERDITVNGGDVTGNGTINLSGGTFTIDGSGTFGGSSDWTFYDLVFGDGSGVTTTTASGSGGITVGDILTVATSQILNAGSKTWTLSGTTGVPLVVSGTLTPSTSTISYTGNNGAGNTTVVPTTYYNLIINNGSETFVPSAGTLSVGGSLTITAGTLNLDTNDPTTTITSNLVITGTLEAPSANGISIGGNFTNNGTFTHNSGTVTFTGAVVHTIDSTNSMSFYNITDTVAGSTLKFKKHTTNTPTFTIANTFTVTGSSGNPVVISSDTGGSQWLVLFSQAQSSITWATIIDSGCAAGTASFTPGATVTNGGGNSTNCWLFLVYGGGGGGAVEGGSGGGIPSSGGGGQGGGGNIQATATASAGGGVVISITVVINGSGYTDVPLVCISGGGGTGATATAVLSGTTVASITVNSGGSGYSTDPTITIVAPPGSNGSCGGSSGGGGQGGGGGGAVD